VRLLLDTHVALWFLDNPGLVAPAARDAIETRDNVTYVSAASVWEAALKQAARRLALPEPLDVGAHRVGFQELSVTWAHGRMAAALPPVHADPFDRMLVAQAAAEDLVLLTRDAVLARYPIATMPA
jgi:PIN domain nuclease of toxin-antitoxin system